MPLSDRLATALKKAGHRTSKTRTTIIETLDARHCCSAQDLASHMSKTGRPTHKTTIYRELDNLLACGAIKELNFGDGQKRYELTHEDDHHHHLVCVCCGIAQPLFLDENLDAKITPKAKKMGFQLTGHTLEFFGFCKACHN